MATDNSKLGSLVQFFSRAKNVLNLCNKPNEKTKDNEREKEKRHRKVTNKYENNSQHNLQVTVSACSKRFNSRAPDSPKMSDINKYKLRKLVRERDALREQVSTLANFNYAREPDFVRDRLKLRQISHEVNRMIRLMNTKYLEPVVCRITETEDQLAKLARRFEEESELMAKEFLDAEGTHDEVQVDKFINEYVAVRKEASKKRTLADRLTKERTSLANLAANLLSSGASRSGNGCGGGGGRGCSSNSSSRSSGSRSSGCGASNWSGGSISGGSERG